MSRPIITGVINAFGDHDVGKTSFCLEYGAEPGRIAFFDDDIKGRATARQLEDAGIKFGKYVDLTKLSEKKTELAFHDAVLAEIATMKKGQFDVIVWDTWTAFANTCHPYVLRHSTDFKTSWSPMGKIKGAQQWQEARRYEAMLINQMLEIAPTVFLIAHLKDYYIGDTKVPNKQIPASSKVMERVPVLRIWLRHNPSGRPVPVGLILKRLDKKVFVPGKGIRTVSVLPRKIVPLENEQSLWDTIHRYWEDPFGDREMTPDEMPDEYELSILDGTLTADQERTFQLMLSSGIAENDEDTGNEIEESVAEQINEMSANGKTPQEIAIELGLTIVQVIKELGKKIGRPDETEDEG